MNTEIQKSIQLLVDGELTSDQRHQLLSSIDAESETWREIAMAFVEKQILDVALGAGIDGADAEPALAAPRARDNNRTLPWWIAIAASLLLGLLAGELWNTNSTSPAVADNSSAMQIGNATKPIEPKSGSKQPQLRLDEALARSIKPLSLQARRELLKAGYLIDEIPQLASVQLPSGQSFEMPVRRFNVQYLGDAAWQ